MRLLVTMNDYDPDLEPLELEVMSFDDLDKIARRVATKVKSFLRTVPVRKMPSRATFDVTAWYEEPAPPKRGKSKREKKPKAEGADGD
jgi:hypothetical protein